MHEKGWQGSVGTQMPCSRPAPDEFDISLKLCVVSRPASRHGRAHWSPIKGPSGGKTGEGAWRACLPSTTNPTTRITSVITALVQVPGGLDFRRSARRFSFPLLCRVRGGTWLASVLRAALRGDPSGLVCGGVPHPCF